MRWNRLGQSLLLLCCAHTLLVQSQKRDSASRSADPAAACTVQIQGRPDGSLAQAQLSCSGGIVTVAADIPAARSQLQTLSSSKGVTWVAGSCGLMPKTCTLAICSAKDSSGADIPLRLSLTVNNYTDTTEGMWGVVCITGKTRADVKVSSPADLLPKHHMTAARCCTALAVCINKFSAGIPVPTPPAQGTNQA